MSDARFFRWTLIFFLLLGAMISFVFLGQLTVRKLRKNPKTKDLLGASFASGWDVLNVAHALSVPRMLGQKFERGALAGLYANSTVLYENTSLADRILARVFFYMLSLMTVLILVEMALDE